MQLNLTKTIAIVAVSLLLGFTMGGCMHELGHGLTALLLGGQVDDLWVFPGVDLYPQPGFSLVDEFPFNLGGCTTSGLDAPWKSNVEALMGSGSTMIVAYLILLIPVLPKAHWITCVAILFSCILAWDIILYSTLPLIGLRHSVFVGGSKAEPFLAAVALGVPCWLYFLLLISHAVVIHVLLVRHWGSKQVITVLCRPENMKVQLGSGKTTNRKHCE
jgi:hypothetical protein